jgi:SAM-dependent methyltransferase
VAGSSEHWDEVYGAKGDRVSWFRPTLDRSLSIIDSFALEPGSTGIDVGAGASTLADDLLDRGFGHVTLVDLSQVALDKTRDRLGDRAADVDFIVGDITTVRLPESAYDLWHDRAVFHFLTEERARQAYIRQVLRSLRPGGRIIVATFGPDGPDQCSGLPTVRYDAAELHATFGETAFEKLGSQRETHQTPWGSAQEFVYCFCRCEAC